MHARGRRRAWLILTLPALALGCQRVPDGPSPLQIKPNQAPSAAETSVTILGNGFFVVAHANYDDPQKAALDRTFAAHLGTNTLKLVMWKGTNELTAVVPPRLAPATYDLVVTDPRGREGTLPHAFTVTGERDAGRDAVPDRLGDRPRERLADGPRLDLRVDAPASPDKPALDVKPDQKKDAFKPDQKKDAFKPDQKKDAFKPDQKKDQKAPDVAVIYYVNAGPGNWGAMTPHTGVWITGAGGGPYIQTSSNYNGYYADAAVPVANYTAETRVMITSIQGVPSWSEGAGLGVRVQSASVPPNPPGMYVCVASPDAHQLLLAKCPGGTSNNCAIQKQTNANVQLGVPVRIIATVYGNQITCSLPDLGATLNMTDNSYPTGGVALITFYADASYDYLKVTP